MTARGPSPSRPRPRWLRFLRTSARAAGALTMIGLLVIWWRYPKAAVDRVWIRPAPGQTFADLPRGRSLSPREVDALARALLSRMTLEQKVLQMSGDTWVWDFLTLRFVGRPWSAGIDRTLRMPAMVMADGPRGVGLGSSTCFPVPMARGASWDRALERRIGAIAGVEMRAHRAHVWLAPCLNLLRHPLWGRAQETYGEDPYLVGEMAAALVEGVQRHNVMACAKHYALNSIEETRRIVDVRADERTLREVYLPHFKRVVDADVATVMTAYNKFEGEYCGENRRLVRDILKGEWGFRGFVMSDWIEAVTDGVKAAEAGLDLEMPMVDVYGPALVQAVTDGRVPADRVDEAVLRMLRRRIDYATRPDVEAYDASRIRAPEHVTAAREAAEQSIVLLANDGVLPLDASRPPRLALIVPLAAAENIGDRGSSRVRPADVVTIQEAFAAALGGPEAFRYDPGADLAAARATARDADVAVVVVGFTAVDEGEYIPELPAADRGGDRRHLGLRPEHRALVEAVTAENRRTIVVLIGGAAIAVAEWADRAAAIVMAFYPGEQGGAAVTRVLFGDVNPSGKLPFTVPRDASQLPPFDNRSAAVEYGYYHGYTLADRKGFEPTYPFGHGLSYTQYRYDGLVLERPEVSEDGVIRAAVDVTNTGDRAGQEVVQLYVGFSGASVERPRKLLRGFEKVALLPRETKTVSFAVPARDLAYYDPGARRWRVEHRVHEILVGPSSRDSELRRTRVRIVAPPASRSPD